MHAIRAAHAFDGTQFLPGGATVFIDADKIVGVEVGRGDRPDGVEMGACRNAARRRVGAAADHAGRTLPLPRR